MRPIQAHVPPNWRVNNFYFAADGSFEFGSVLKNRFRVTSIGRKNLNEQFSWPPPFSSFMMCVSGTIVALTKKVWIFECYLSIHSPSQPFFSIFSLFFLNLILGLSESSFYLINRRRKRRLMHLGSVQYTRNGLQSDVSRTPRVSSTAVAD